MEIDITEILTGKGLGIIRFGMLSKDLILLLGVPDEIEVYCYSNNLNDRSEQWYFKEKEMSIYFNEEEGWKLETIAVNSDTFHFKNLIRMDQSMEKVKLDLKELGFEDLEFEDCSNIESPDHQLISVDEISMNFWFDHGRLSEIQWSPLFKDDETIIWPDLKQNENNTKNDIPEELRSLHPFDQLGIYLENWLDKVFLEKNSRDYLDLSEKLPENRKREYLIFESKNIRYFLSNGNETKWKMKGEVYLKYKDQETVGRISVLWNEQLEIIKQQFFFD